MARKSKIPKDMSILFQSSKGTLAQIKTKTNSLALLSDIVRQICPDLPEDAWNIANFRHNTLILEVNSPVWGQRLQFERFNICRELTLQTQGQFEKIEIKVNPQAHQKMIKNPLPTVATASIEKKSQINDTQLSSKVAQQLLNAAENAPKGLKEKLRKLAVTASRKTN